MQTFLPYPSFGRSAQALDRARLGKQRVEGLQILKACLYESAWSNHPAVKMWVGYEYALHRYIQAICSEWMGRGYRDSVAAKTWRICIDEGIFDEPLEKPPWLGRADFHRSHQSNLTRKLPDHYGPQWPDTPNDLPYVWPQGGDACEQEEKGIDFIISEHKTNTYRVDVLGFGEVYVSGHSTEEVLSAAKRKIRGMYWLWAT